MDLNYVTINNVLMKRGKGMNEKKKRKVISWEEIKERFKRESKNNGRDKKV